MPFEITSNHGFYYAILAPGQPQITLGGPREARLFLTGIQNNDLQPFFEDPEFGGDMGAAMRKEENTRIVEGLHNAHSLIFNGEEVFASPAGDSLAEVMAGDTVRVAEREELTEAITRILQVIP